MVPASGNREARIFGETANRPRLASHSALSMNPADHFESRDVSHQLVNVDALIGVALALSRQVLKFAASLRQQEFQSRDFALSGNIDVAQALQRILHRSLPGVSLGQ
jgi:hypothetical protein